MASEIDIERKRLTDGLILVSSPCDIDNQVQYMIRVEKDFEKWRIKRERDISDEIITEFQKVAFLAKLRWRRFLHYCNSPCRTYRQLKCFTEVLGDD